MARKKNVITVRLVSEETGYFYTTTKNARKSEKLKVRKYDPKLRKHVSFVEKKA